MNHYHFKKTFITLSLLIMLLLLSCTAYANTENLTAEQWIKKGYEYYLKKDYDNSIDANFLPSYVNKTVFAPNLYRR